MSIRTTLLSRLRNVSVGLLAAATLLSCEQYQDPINVVGNSWLGYQPFYVQNILHPELTPTQLNVTMLVSDVSVLRMLTNQAAAVAFLSLDNALSLNSRTDLNFCIAAVLTSSYGADAVLAHSDIDTKLSGEEPLLIGMEDSALSRFILSRWIELHEINPQRIKRQIVTPAGQLRAFERKQFDAVIAYAPFSQQLEQAGAVTVFSSREIKDEIIDTVIVRQSAWRQHKEALKSYVTNNWDQAIEAIANNQSEDFSTLAQLTGLSKPELKSALAGLQLYNSQASREFLATRYDQVSATVASHLVDSGLHANLKALPVCEGVL
ncbi:ABC transporter substrate-binding protein [Pseudidiomarina donghaiensis]|uniref:ABC transporter substrate-binding protein n=1 Tax=Pseudidiomarina donghaiensis TaxID=519452 RepID=UPI0008E2F186|nr:ABC transporter substrate-binding protein [Pseudidiomarina donghaiensis]SFV20642.1 NitT/TauT family transport system substrate-binding protein [Pseudidiomarina donghaiensis]